MSVHGVYVGLGQNAVTDFVLFPDPWLPGWLCACLALLAVCRPGAGSRAAV